MAQWISRVAELAVVVSIVVGSIQASAPRIVHGASTTATLSSPQPLSSRTGAVVETRRINSQVLNNVGTSTNTPTYTPTTTPTPTQTATPTNTPTATPIPPAIVVHGRQLKARQGVLLNNAIVGSFPDPAGLPPFAYQAVIDWGDGSPPSNLAQRAVADHSVPSEQVIIQQVYTITGSHRYALAGIYPIDITISANDGRAAYLTSIEQVGDTSK